MLPRLAATAVDDALRRSPVVALLGPRQVGKTTLARALVDRTPDALYLDLELPSEAARLADPEAYLGPRLDRLIVLDEVHRAPGLFQVLRGLVDRARRGSVSPRILVLGSASPALLRQGSETLAGRIAFVELGPLLPHEVAGNAPAALERLWVRGGFPASFLAANDAEALAWRLDFVRTYLERDIPELGPRIPAETMRRLWTMLAHEQGGLLNAAKLAGSLAVSGQTIARYLDLLVDLLLVRRMPAFATNAGKRLVRSPKIYLRDSGLVHALLGLRTLDDVLGHPVAGGSWEGLVVEAVAAAAPSPPCFYRTAAGAEIDIVLETPRGPWAIEVKRSLAPVPSRGFYIGCDDISAVERLVAYPGDEAFPLAGGAEAVPVLELVARIRAFT
jgi:predicted AAA+ superfamily ATPase